MLEAVSANLCEQRFLSLSRYAAANVFRQNVMNRCSSTLVQGVSEAWNLVEPVALPATQKLEPSKLWS